ncbi:MAG: DNA/RNA nuclease SfsA [Candidatus Lokiarchaeota archaeon]|nr:DNA/RNA nuclease SfsA [Candidatus Lokiarchaeota archaeon]
MKKLFEIPDLVESSFLNRPNRFVAEIKYEGRHSIAHIHDPGRLRELLIPDARLLMAKGTGKLPWYIKAVYHSNEWILIDSALQRNIATKLFTIMDEFKDFQEIRAEIPLGNSRIDFMLDEVPLECKGVSLVKEDVALFPDAPTKRGTRHVEEILKYNGMILFIIFRSSTSFAPNIRMDPEFSEKLKEARNNNVPIICAQIKFDGKNVYYTGRVPLGEF